MKMASMEVEKNQIALAASSMRVPTGVVQSSSISAIGATLSANKTTLPR